MADKWQQRESKCKNIRYEHTQLNIVQYTAHLTLTVNLKTPLRSDDYQYGTNILSISISDVYNWFLYINSFFS